MFSLQIALALLCASSGMAMVNHEVSHVLQPMSNYRQDCWQKRPVSLMQRFPGAGLGAVEPYSTVFMDGFMQVACVKDYMYEHGDKFGNNKYVYEIAASHNVSIVHYTEVVAREDQKAMTHEVCFEFCRTVPEMLFFGVTQGRDCYCAPYYEQMAGDSSMCDAVCEGSSATMCGGMKKSSIFAMHKCDDAAENLNEAVSALGEVMEDLSAMATAVKALADEGQSVAAALQEKLGSAGDPTASDLMQSAKVRAGELVHPAEDALSFVTTVAAAKAEAEGVVESVADSEFASATTAEDMTEKAKTATAEGEGKLGELEELKQSACPVYPVLEGAPNATAQYMPLMYFVNKEFEEVPSTCGGDVVKTPMFNMTADGCAKACDANIHKCVGFSFYQEGVCFLMSKFTSVTYYTGCGAAEFLQKAKKTGLAATCYAKLSSFEGQNLAPNPSGKCEQCLKSATKAERCF